MSLGTNYAAYVGASSAVITDATTGDLISVAYLVARIGDPFFAYSTEIETIKSAPETRNLVSLDTASVKAANLSFSGSTNHGLIVNSLTTAERNALADTAGAIAFDTDLSSFFSNDGAAWNEFGGGGDFSNGGEAGTANRTLGNTDAFDIGIITNNLTRMTVDSAGLVGVGTASPVSLFHIHEGNLGITAAAAPQLRIAPGAESQVGVDAVRTMFGQVTAGSQFVNGSVAFDTCIRGRIDGRVIIGQGQTNFLAEFSTSGSILSTSLSFDLVTHAGIRLNNLTTTERNALTGSDGDTIFNETSQEVQTFFNSSWNVISNHGAYGSFYHDSDQTFTADTTADILFNQEIHKSGITHSTVTNSQEFTYDIAGTYEWKLEPQVSKTGGGGTDRINFFYAIDTGGGFNNVAASNIIQSIPTANLEQVTTLTIQHVASVGHKIKFRAQADDNTIFLDATAASGSDPNDIPLTPSVILNCKKILNAI